MMLSYGAIPVARADMVPASNRAASFKKLPYARYPLVNYNLLNWVGIFDSVGLTYIKI